MIHYGRQQYFDMTVPPIVLDKKDIGKTMIFCAMCTYKRSEFYGVVPRYCPKCGNELLFMEVSEEFFK